MSQFSAILTSVNRVSLDFKERIHLTSVFDERTEQFARHMHRSRQAEFVVDETGVQVFTTRGSYRYSCLSGKYFRKITDLDRNTFYRIS